MYFGLQLSAHLYVRVGFGQNLDRKLVFLQQFWISLTNNLSCQLFDFFNILYIQPPEFLTEFLIIEVGLYRFFSRW